MQESSQDKSTKLTEDIHAIFEHWKIRTGHVRSKLDQKRRSKIRQRLCDGYTRGDLIEAVEGCAISPYHTGKNELSMVYDDIELICRDAKHVDMFLKVMAIDKAKKAQEAARKKREREEAERDASERRERAGQTRISGLRGV